jgi:photosystem II stability/assembly factor-like uncharacterized protein
MRDSALPAGLRRARGLLAALAIALAARPVLAQPGQTACQSRQGGPCRTPEPFAFLPSPPYPSEVVVANFGLLLPAPAGGGWQFVCDDRYGVPPTGGVWRAPEGRLLAAGRAGLHWSDDGCAWSPASGDLAGALIADVAIERGPAGRIWALGAGPRLLHRSTDGGRTFQALRTFPAAYTFPRLLAAPSETGRLYLAAATVGATTVLESSRDGGETWMAREITAGLQPPPRNPLGLLAVAPDDAGALYFAIVDQDGDQIWKSADGGQTLTRILQLPDGEVLGGFAFGPTGRTVFVAGNAPIVVGDRPPAHLYRSDDGGGSWAAPIASGGDGPFFRCLGFSAGRLLACGTGETGGDRFLVGASMDQGRSWTPVVRLADVSGPRACVRDSCFATEAWLCETFGRCSGSPALADGEAADADADAGTARAAGGGCACGLTPRPGPAGGARWPFLLLAGLTGQKLARNAARAVAWLLRGSAPS